MCIASDSDKEIHYEYQLDEHQQAAVEALVELKRICEKHGIKYYLIAGSALGAVRHGGMIPWDDDIDVGLLYGDWYKLREVLPKELNSKFQYVDDTIEDTWPRPFGKILYERTNCIDLFLIAKWTSNPVSGYLHWIAEKISRGLYTASVNNIPPLILRPEANRIQHICTRLKYITRIYVLKPLRKIISRKGNLKILRWNERYYENKSSKWYINLFSVYPMKKEMIKADWVESQSLVTYEGEQYTTFGDTDAYLTHLYGDYMQLPPEEERIKLHSEVFK